MKTNRYCISVDNISVRLVAFEGVQQVNEYWATFTVADPTLDFDTQFNRIEKCIDMIRHSTFDAFPKGLQQAKRVFSVYYLSDSANQEVHLRQLLGKQQGAVAIIQQPPLGGGKIGLLLYMTTGTVNQWKIEMLSVAHNGYEELWSVAQTSSGNTSYEQTLLIFSHYAGMLRLHQCTLANNCIRTWLYINDIDNHYVGMVKGRNEVFDSEQLTNQTHYIASTGIGGRMADQQILCSMNAYAVKGITEEQIHYLYAPEYLNSTSEYGVRFERGTYIDFAGRRKVFISGTASIDNKGSIVHMGDIKHQLQRTWQNINALLTEAQCTFEDVTQFTVYLRDTADYTLVHHMMNETFPHTPFIITLAPVCRPGWLVEIECMAIRSI